MKLWLPPVSSKVLKRTNADPLDRASRLRLEHDGVRVELVLAPRDGEHPGEVGVEHAGEVAAVLAAGQRVEARLEPAGAPGDQHEREREGRDREHEPADDEGCVLGHERVEVAHGSSAGVVRV